MKTAISTIYTYHVNTNSDIQCKVCRQFIANPKNQTKAFAHKKLNQKYIERIWRNNPTWEDLGKSTSDALMTQIFHKCVKDNLEKFKDRVPENYVAKSETTSCFFHPECIKKALVSSSSCPTCDTELEAPKGLLSFKDKCLQKINQARKAISPYCSPTALKKAMKAGYDGAVIGTQFVASVLLTQMLGISETPWDDMKAFLKSSCSTTPEEIEQLESLTWGAFAFSTAMWFSHLLMHVMPQAVALSEAEKDQYIKALDTMEKKLATPGVSQVEKLRLTDDIEKIKNQIKNTEDSSSLTLLRAAFLTLLIGGTYLKSGTPGIVVGAAGGVLAGGTFSTKQITQMLPDMKPIEDLVKKLKEPAKKAFAALMGGCFAAAIAQSAGLGAEGQTIAGGFGAGAASSFI
ncbi:MAG: hypothetical protein A3D96_01630 [Chlamydiae bacterium RIFCSPHIGHO2_12_FULL_44_59]|nr:MAG: hypothetical protein A2796_01205 [Chlamydiae bacterium RIFCSPHIGHO2_01_FULL_44_39]OGN59031.1 MAG: hypothetical protein A3C42_03210 [Chlamydiae bacterium RIFCSPHIGHO2_02_FULL_45_9]OGN60559.1 MAG: hypothetical protein A3D96_01630 [Chlamydiae bacterium RIFCSPHIGHO2_12_FULL_44_59]OGN66013.1 MAG: hypothetical protein A2978_04920 [Chlamydiae bacterium RIFCSPLOWO2_01_FULL_44_52]OGN68829.1 MAG: hypothetical protein A3I67_00580 [Chlamydiae bacterium RIFCSPLOWO2_02_FULL_45_22]OGN70469.1 MAG: hyp